MTNYQQVMVAYFPNDPFKAREPFTEYHNFIFLGTHHSQVELDGLWLDTLKKKKKAAIDFRTRELFDQEGFTYKGIHFSLSPISQLNWTGIKTKRKEIDYPFGVSTLDGGEYLLKNRKELDKFTFAAMEAGTVWYSQGRALKLRVNDATTEEEIDAIVDER